jgi:hypothetical protein
MIQQAASGRLFHGCSLTTLVILLRDLSPNVKKPPDLSIRRLFDFACSAPCKTADSVVTTPSGLVT